MNGIDIAILSIMGLSVIMGAVRGLTREILGLLTWAGAALATYVMLPLTRDIARGHVANPMIADTITCVILFIFALIFFSILTNMISSSVRESTLGGVDKALGFGFGVIRGAFLLSAAELTFSAFTPRQAQATAIQNAKFTPLIQRGGDTLRGIIPQKWHDQLTKAVAKTPTTSENTTNKITEQAIDQTLNNSEISSVLKSLDSAHKQTEGRTGGSFEARPTPPHTPQDTQKTAESLAYLTPKTVEAGKEDYDARQKREMDRLFQTSQ